MGVEPTMSSFADCRLTTWLRGLARLERIELPGNGFGGRAVPNTQALVAREGFEPS